MKSLLQYPTSTTPELNFNPASGNITIQGRSIMINAKEYWCDIKEWMLDYSKNPAHTTTVNFQFEYLNSTSTTEVLKFLRIAENILLNKKTITINWFVDKEDEHLYDLGLDMKQLTNHNLNLIQLN